MMLMHPGSRWTARWGGRRLPLARAKAVVGEEKRRRGDRRRMPAVPHISIVDDDDSLRDSLENLIRSFGFRTQGFRSATAFLSSSQARETACLILDVRMPGLNGLDLQRQMMTENWRVPIIFITS